MQGSCPYPWQLSYIAAVLETNPSLTVDKVLEAVAALEHRLLNPLEPGSAEETALKLARVVLARLRDGRWQGSNGVL